MCGEDPWEIVLKKLRPINLETSGMLCLQISEGKNIVNFGVHEDISLILVHCLRESVGGHCWGL